MRKIRNFIFLLVIAGTLWHFYGDTFNQSGAKGVFEEMRTDVNALKENPKVITTVNYIDQEIQSLIDKLEENSPDKNQVEKSSEEKQQLDAPSDSEFSVYNIKIGDKRSEVEQQTGKPQRSSLNEYGVDWVAYHKNYRNFLMVAYNEQNKVAGLYTNQDLVTAMQGITYKTSKKEVRDVFNEPVKSIRKGFVNYQVQNNQEYDTFHTDSNYVTIFYDKHEDNTVTAIQIISDELERQKEKFFGKPSEELKKGFEYQLFDLTNAARVSQGLPVLTWDKTARKTARDHSADMAKNNYFGHTNLEGQSPFDRMEEDNIGFRTAGENLAAGQPSSIFAHEGLMNSSGHRKNILQKHFEKLAIGVAFNTEAQPYYTETFWAD